MADFKFISEDSTFTTYAHKSNYVEISLHFNRKLKCVDITYSRFIRNDEPMLEPQTDWIRHSAKYGHWQSESPCLSASDIEFVHNKCKELFDNSEPSEVIRWQI